MAKKKIKTFEEACNAVGTTAAEFEASVKGMPEKLQRFVSASGKIGIVVEALNEGWKPNWDDFEQKKYYPWFYMDSKIFSLDDVYYDCGCSYVSSRLCFKSSELAEYATKTFTDLYKEYMLL